MITRFQRTPRIASRVLPQALWSFPRQSREVFLTFDDGPHSLYTLQLVELLAQYDARATFFVVGEKVRQYPQLVRETVAAGHRLGNHTMHHLRMRWTPVSVVREEISSAQKVIEQTAGEAVYHFRPPYGVLRPAVLGFASRLGLKVTMWSCMPLDFRRASDSPAIAASLARHLRGGDIVLLHDGHDCAPAMMQALRETLHAVKEKGYRFASLPNAQ